MSDTPDSVPAEAPKPVRRRASRAAGPTAAAAATVATVMTRVDSPTKPVASLALGPPRRRQPNRRVVALAAAAVLVVIVASLSALGAVLLHDTRGVNSVVARDQRFVDVASQTVVNMFTYTPDNIDESVSRFIDGTSGPLRDMMSQNNNAENLKALFRDTHATSEAVVNGAALEAVDEDAENGSVLVAVRVTVTDIDGVNKPSQAYRLRVIVHEDDNGRMTGYDLKYPNGGN